MSPLILFKFLNSFFGRVKLAVFFYYFYHQVLLLNGSGYIYIIIYIILYIFIYWVMVSPGVFYPSISSRLNLFPGGGSQKYRSHPGAYIRTKYRSTHLLNPLRRRLFGTSSQEQFSKQGSLCPTSFFTTDTREYTNFQLLLVKLSCCDEVIRLRDSKVPSLEPLESTGQLCDVPLKSCEFDSFIGLSNVEIINAPPP